MEVDKVGEKSVKHSSFNPFSCSTPCSPATCCTLEQELTGHKAWLPAKRSLYGSLYRGDLGHAEDHAHSAELQATLYGSEASQKKLVDFLVDGSDDSSAAEDEPSIVQWELQAVMRIKLQFFQWFEAFCAKTMDVFSGA